MAFAAHLRDPQRAPAPADVEDRRMAIYRELVFNNVSSLLAANFPVLHRLLDGPRWDAAVRDFFIRHRCRTPLFLELSEEFLDYIQNERTSPDDPPFLLELAHYEWVELALEISDVEPDLSCVDPNGDLVSAAPVVSPLVRNLAYRFPVHRIRPEFQPGEPPAEPTRLLAYRGRGDRIEILEINAVTQRLIQLLQQTPSRTGLDILNQLTAELRHPRPDAVLAFGAQQLEDLRARGAILGARTLR